MTTKVIVQANHGWPVEVEFIRPEGFGANGLKETVKPNETRDFYVHSTQELRIREVQPEEIQAEARAPAA